MSAETLYKQILKALSDKEDFSPLVLAQMTEAADKNHGENNINIYELIDQTHLKKESASTALNINREFLFSAHSLINALEQLKLLSAQAKTVSEMLNLKIS